MKSILLGSIAALSLFAFAPEAAAAIVSVSYTGIVTYDYDQTGEFGTIGGYNDLVGDSYNARYVFDTTKGYASSSTTQNRADGGSVYGNDSPVISASVTVNGYTQSIVGNYLGRIFGYQDGNEGEQQHLAMDYKVNVRDKYLYNFIDGHDMAIPATITGPFTVVTKNNYYYNAGEYADLLYTGNNNELESYTQVNANITTLTVSAVPEPSTWALMLLGFAGFGFAGYRRTKRKSEVAFSAA